MRFCVCKVWHCCYLFKQYLLNDTYSAFHPDLFSLLFSQTHSFECRISIVPLWVIVHSPWESCGRRSRTLFLKSIHCFFFFLFCLPFSQASHLLQRCRSNPLLCHGSRSAAAQHRGTTACFNFSRGKPGPALWSPASPDVP